MKKVATISKANLYMRIFDYSENFLKEILLPFIQARLTKYEEVPDPKTGRSSWEISHVFAHFNNDSTELRLSVELLPELLKFARGKYIMPEHFNFVDEPEIIPLESKVGLKEQFRTPRAHQEDWIKYQMNDQPLVINNMVMGDGKTWCALHLLTQLKSKTVIIVQPRYIPLWKKAFGEQMDFGLEQICILDNNTIDELNTSVTNGIINPDIFIIPMTRIQSHIKLAEENPSVPDLGEVFNNLGIGLRIYDEVHEAFHQVYLSLLFGNNIKTLMLSATIESDDKFIDNLYKIVINKRYYLKETEYREYVKTYAVHYHLNIRHFKIAYKAFGKYNDNVFERSVMRNKKTREFYLDMILKCYEKFYLSQMEEGTKCLLFFSKVTTVHLVTNYLKSKYPDMDIYPYTGEQSKKKELKDEYFKHNTLVSTPGSCGTGKDIPGLITVICSHNVSSRPRNKQIFGRNRDIKKMFPHLDPTFVYLVCADIDKHRAYDRKRKEIFSPMSLEQKDIYYPVRV